ncbi:LiaF domain-containing protein [Halobacillus sp. BBL2006]|uniref:LiaF domain-containing protein n=1 Tax=Halobacillus sp. BBL2006 TaxID=1543706 RepID=UPI000542DEA0|nr:LiaF domain-containing protein [Halobacillus sp. BBL2006]KHE72082.1 hypothetical protein LD39_06410 [Halobacillus sp. BBL2006]
MSFRSMIDEWFADRVEEDHQVREVFTVEPDQPLTFSSDLGIGELGLSCCEGEEARLDASYSKTPPQIKYKGQHLKVFQDTKGFKPWKKDKQRWSIYVPRNNSFHLNLNLGAGNSTIDLKELELRKLKISCGIGDCHLHFTNIKVTQDIPVKIDGGVGNQVIHLSDDVPAVIQVNKGMGKFNGENLIPQGSGRYCTRAYQQGRPHMKMKLNVGVGDVSVRRQAELIKSESV